MTAAGERRRPELEIRVYGDLNRFLAPSRRQRAFRHPFDGYPSVKDVLEGLGIPHTEVELVLVNGEPLGFAHHVRDGDRVAAYPPLATLELDPGSRATPPPPEPVRFMLDVHLGRLGRILRLLGLDAAATGSLSDAALAARAAADGRVLLTRDRGLLKRAGVRWGHLVRSDDPEEQAVEVIRRFGLEDRLAPFTRCTACGAALRPAAGTAVVGRVEPGTLQAVTEFRTCEGCGKVFWRGAHGPALAERVGRILARLGRRPE